LGNVLEGVPTNCHVIACFAAFQRLAGQTFEVIHEGLQGDLGLRVLDQCLISGVDAFALFVC
jgi:hypothetical protein